jgi:hypothetical protein
MGSVKETIKTVIKPTVCEINQNIIIKFGKKVQNGTANLNRL